MILKTYSFQTTGVGTMVVDDDISNEKLAEAMLLNAREEHGSNGKPIKVKEKNDGQV